MGKSIKSGDAVEVKAFLRNGELVALPVGSMAAVFRVVHDETQGETEFEYFGLASITGAFNTVRMHSVAGFAQETPVARPTKLHETWCGWCGWRGTGKCNCGAASYS